MLILQDTINDERSRRSSEAAGPGPASAPGPAPGPTPTPTASQNNHEPPGQIAGCSQPSIIPNPASSSSVRSISAACDVSVDSQTVMWRMSGGWCKLQYLPRKATGFHRLKKGFDLNFFAKKTLPLDGQIPLAASQIAWCLAPSETPAEQSDNDII